MCTAAQLPFEPCLHQGIRERLLELLMGQEVTDYVTSGKTAQGSGDRMAIYSPRRGVLKGSRPVTPGSWASASETARKKFIHVARASWFVVFGSGRPSADSGFGKSRPCLTPNL